MFKSKVKGIKTRNILLGIGVATVVAVPAITLPLVLKTHKATSLSQYASNPRQLALDLRDKYDDLSIKAQQSKDYVDMVSYLKNLEKKDAMDLDVIVKKINQSSMSTELKEFMLQNYLDKVSTQKDYDSNVEPVKPKITHSVETKDIEKHKSDQIPGARYVLSDVSVENAQAWDIDEAKGVIDPITGKYFAQLLGDAQRIHKSGWYNSEADEHFEAHNVKLTFKDLYDDKVDSIYLHYNAAQRCDWYTADEDYAFVAMLAADKNHIVDDPKHPGTKVPSIFGLALNWTDMNNFEAWSKLTWRHSPYIASFHEVDAGGDDEGGNYLDGITIPGKVVPTLNGREGTKAMSHIAKNLYEFINITLNTEPINYINEVNPNYLYENIGDKNWVYYEQGGKKVPLDNITFKDTNYNVFADDETIFHESNQKLLDEATSFTMKNMYSENSEVFNNFIPNLNMKNDNGIWKFSLNTADSLGISKLIDDTLIKRNILTVVEAKGLMTSLGSGMQSKELFQILLRKSSIQLPMGFLGDILFNSLIYSISNFNNLNAEDWVDELAKGIIPSLLSGVGGIILGPVGAILGGIISEILTNIDVGNGHSFSENIGDHGLNDWEYQWKNNEDNMIKIQNEWSNSFTKGVNWKVVDGWFTCPHLYIQTNGDADWTGVSKDVSHGFGSTFNYGRKIDFLPKK